MDLLDKLFPDNIRTPINQTENGLKTFLEPAVMKN